ncbi:hypothetical protein BpHYR1_013274 [Brachionus plicatilis]|uniref:Uncharacterized protein n=1 Tax=Brachionus plicatilis TaxID=10195 RepID=A0A3M7SQI3_BRAPC|nr:hypothetical protein BpHYR1_013274 [Brachionus plicatilis]
MDSSESVWIQCSSQCICGKMCVDNCTLINLLLVSYALCFARDLSKHIKNINFYCHVCSIKTKNDDDSSAYHRKS